MRKLPQSNTYKMSKLDIETRVCEILAEHFDLDVDSIDMDSDLVLDLGADSLDEEEIAIILEDQFGIDIPSNMDYLSTVRSIVNYINDSVALDNA